MVLNRKDWILGEPTTGTVSRIIEERGFAFLKADDNQEEYFLHFSEFDQDFKSLKVGQLIDFTPAQTDKGLRACSASRHGTR